MYICVNIYSLTTYKSREEIRDPRHKEHLWHVHDLNIIAQHTCIYLRINSCQINTLTMFFFIMSTMFIGFMAGLAIGLAACIGLEAAAMSGLSYSKS